MMLRPFLFILLFVLAVALPTPFLIIAGLIYALRYTAYELILIAFSIDAFYGLHTPLLPYYTITAVLGLIFIEWLKPHLSVYNQ